MDLETLQWDDEILKAFDVPRSMLPEIKSSSEVYGQVESSSLLREVPVAGILGDQQAATFGQAAFDTGEAKNTYGTGNFLLLKDVLETCNPNALRLLMLQTHYRAPLDFSFSLYL